MGKTPFIISPTYVPSKESFYWPSWRNPLEWGSPRKQCHNFAFQGVTTSPALGGKENIINQLLEVKTPFGALFFHPKIKIFEM
jgi:hypothetical protein